LNNDTLDYANGNDGTNNGAVQNKTSFAIGGSYTFDGVDDKISIPAVLSSSTTEFTYSLWAKGVSDTSTSSLFAYRQDDIFTIIRANSGGIPNDIRFLVFVSGADFDVTVSTDFDSWHLYTVTAKENDNAVAYIDGVQVAIGSIGTFNDVVPQGSFIGAGRQGINHHFDGEIDEVFVYNRLLSASEVRQLYYGGLLGGHTLNSSLTTTGDNWTLGVRAGDSGNTFGDEVNSSSMEILAGGVNITETLTQNETQVVSGGSGGIVTRGDNVTINATVTGIGGSVVDSVWVIIWEGIVGGPQILLQYLTNIVGDLWSITIGTNVSFPEGEVNYTIFANDSFDAEVNVSASFNTSAGLFFINGCNTLSEENATYVLQNNVVTTSTCFTLNANNITIDMGGFNITGDEGVSDHGFLIDGFNGTILRNGGIFDFSDGIRLVNASYGNYSNLTINSHIGSGIRCTGDCDNNLFEDIIMNDSAIAGVFFDNSHNNTFINIFGKGNAQSALALNTNNFDNIVINLTSINNPLDGLFIGPGSGGNIFINLISHDNGDKEIEDTSGGGTTNTLVYNNSLAEISWTKTDLDTTNSLTFPGNISIGNNTAFYNPISSGSNDLINSSANITFRGIPTFGNPIILKDGVFCGDCTNFTSLTGAVIIFNTSSWSNHTIGSGTPNVTSITLNTTSVLNVTTDNLTGFVTANDPNGDNVTIDFNWYKTNSTDTNVTIATTLLEDSDLVGYWPLNNDTLDYANGNDGTASNGAFLNYSGKVGAGYHFGGLFISGSRINVGESAFDFGSGAFSLSTWFNFQNKSLVSGDTGRHEVLAKRQSGVGYRMRILSNNVLRWLINTGSNSFITVKVNQNRWYHAVAIYNGTDILLYLNGVLVNQTSASGNTNNNDDFFIGFTAGDFPRPFNGTIDELAIYGRELSASEVRQLYYGGLLGGHTLNSSLTTFGDNWTFGARAGDSIAFSNESNSSLIEIENSVPVVSSLTLNSTSANNFTTDNLTLSFDVSDVDGHNVKNITDWTIDGNSIAVLNMPFEPGNSNSTDAKDYSTFSNNGSVSGATFSATSGYDGRGAYDFDGSPEVLTVSDDSSIDFGTNSFAISVWVNLDSFSNFGSIVAKGDNIAAATPGLFLGTTPDGRIRFRTRDSSEFYSERTTATLSTGTWYHVIANRIINSSGEHLELYVDGVKFTDSPISNGATPADVDVSDALQIGGDTCGACVDLDGRVDDVIIFNHSLSPEQITTLFENRTDLIVSQETVVGEVWQARITPNDGIEDGVTVTSNAHTIESGINITAVTTQNDTQVVAGGSGGTVARGNNVTINATVTNVLGETVDSVWVVIWEGIVGGTQILLQYLTNVIGDLWSTTVDTNISFNLGEVNYTIFANDSFDNEVNQSANFTLITGIPSITSVTLNATSPLNVTIDNLTGFVVASDPNGDNITFDYNWYKTNSTDTNVTIATTILGNETGLLSYWPFNNDSLDYAGDNDGSLVGDGFINETGGKVFGGVYSDGTLDYVSLSTISDDLDGLPELSVSMWVRIDSFADDAELFDRWCSSNLYFKSRYTMGSGFRGFYSTSGSNQAGGTFAGTDINLGEWHHAVYVYNGTALVFYLDSIKSVTTYSSLSGNLASVTCNAVAGINSNTLNENNINGTMDELLIYNRTLTAAEVRQLYYGGLLGGHTLNSSLTTFGDNWTFGARAGDSTEGFSLETNSSSITIENSVPVVNNVTLNATSTSNFTTDNLTGFVTFFDADDHNITLDYNWYKTNSTDAGKLIATTMLEDSGLIGYWSYNNDTLDYANDNDGTLTGAIWEASGRVGAAYSFDGTDDFINISNDPSLNFGEGDFSISLWFNASSVSEIAGGLVSKIPASFIGGYELVYVDAGTDFFYFYVCHTDSCTTFRDVQYVSSSELDNDWHHLVAKRESNELYLFMDGVDVSGTRTGSATDVNVTSNVNLEFAHSATYGFPDASFDEVLIYNKSLSLGEVRQLYYGGLLGGDVLNSSLTTTGDNWTLGVRAGDLVEFGSEFNSSQIEILPGINITAVTTQNDTQVVAGGSGGTVARGNNVTINATVTNVLGETVDSVWVVIWEGIVGGTQILLQYLTNVIGDLWSTTIDTNISFNLGEVNYTIFANDSFDNEVNQSANFTLITGIPSITSVTLNATSPLNVTTDNLTGFVVASDPNGDNITFDYNWYKTNSTDTNVTIATTLIYGALTYLPLNNDTLDYVGSNDGTNNGAIQNKTSFAVGGSYTFDGATDRIDLGTNVYGNLDLGNGSISVWVNTHSATGSKRAYDFEGVLFLDVDPNGVWRQNLYDGSSSNLRSTNVEVNRWVHFVNTWNGTDQLIYQDGILVNSTSSGSPALDSFSRAWNIGAAFNNGALWDGNVDELIVYNRTLTASEIRQLYYGGLLRGHTLNSSLTTFADNWTLGVRAGDSTEGFSSETNSSSITIENSVPVVNNVTLNATSENNFTTDNLTGFVIFFDADDQNITLDYNWYKTNSTDTNVTIATTFLEDPKVTAYYPLNNDTRDYSGNRKNDGITFGAVLNYSGQVGAGYSFDGIDDRIDHFSSDVTEQFTASVGSISIWIKPTGTTGSFANVFDAEGIAVNRGTDTMGILRGTFNGLDRIWVYNFDGDEDATGLNYTVDEWTHVVWVHADGRLLAYQDGELRGNISSGDTNPFTNNMEFGRNAFASEFFNGTLDEVIFYNKSLSLGEVRQLYYGGLLGGDVLNSSLTTTGDNWTLGVRAGDSIVFGTELNSSQIEILSGINITSTLTQNETQVVSGGSGGIVTRGDNVTINATVTNLGGEPVDSVWVIIWEGIVGGTQLLLQYLTNIIGNLWSVTIDTNFTLPEGEVNYTIFANDSFDNEVNVSASFNTSINLVHLEECDELDEGNTTYVLQKNIVTTGTCFNITSNDVTLDFNGFNITGDDGVGDFGVYSKEHNTSLIKNGGIYDFEAGVYLISNIFNTTVNNMTFESNKWGVIVLSSNRKVVISNSIFSHNTQYGVYLVLNSHNNTVIGNTFINNIDNGIRGALFASDNRILDNEINGSEFGISISTAERYIIRNNTIYNNSQRGILISSTSNNNLIELNRISNNTLGLSIGTASSENVILNNQITGNGLFDLTDNGESGTINSLIYNNSFGEILWAKTNLTVNEVKLVHSPPQVPPSFSITGLANPLSPILLKVTFALELIEACVRPSLLKKAVLFPILIFPGKVKSPITVKLVLAHKISPKLLL